MRLKAMYLCSNRSSGCFAGNMFKDQKRWTCTMHSGSKTIQLVNFTDNPIFVGRSFKLSWFWSSACNKTYVGQVGGGWYGLKVPRWIFLSSRLNCCGFLFPGCRLVFGKNGRCVFKNIGKDCLFRPLSLSLCSGHAGTSCLSSAISQLWPPERSGFRWCWFFNVILILWGKHFFI